MFEGDMMKEIEAAIPSYPVIPIVRPIQSGKTTVAKHIAPDKPYYNLQQPNTGELLEDDPVRVLNQCPDGAIFDEVQHSPELLSYIQVVVDEKNREGLFITTGSHQPTSHNAVSQSLASSAAMLNLLPLCIHELAQHNITLSLYEYLFNGFMPRVYDKKIHPSKYNRDYLQAYIENDVRTLINLKDLMTFQKFLELCTSRVGQILNYSSLSNELGVSHPAVKHLYSGEEEVPYGDFMVINFRSVAGVIQ
jgi:predicted AAA+ superfamily ATPase